jgi:O-antigen/teichoic acid export membrane protein
VTLIAKPEYAGASGVILLILTAYLLQGVYYILSAGAVVTDQTRWISLVAAIGALVSLGVNFALIPSWGIRGAAWAALFSYLFLAVLMRRVSERHYPMPLERRRLALLLGGMAAVLAVNLLVLDGPSPGMALARLLPLGLYPLYLRWTGFFSAEERVRMRGLIRRVAGPRRPSV